MESMRIGVTFPGGKKVLADFGDMAVLTDQSVKDGGEGAAPEPGRLFFAAVATCSGHYALAFCQNRNIDTSGLALSVRCEPDSRTRLVGTVEIEVTLPPGFPEKYREAIVRAVEACWVKKHFEHPPLFSVRAL
ncbi:MAG: OsmC family protein [Thermodesulfobacteriota bacterium]